ncbi:MAG TPA: alpha/beta hydrolase [Candidatus Binatia bacterium]|jgi:4,5:9,10-diseco-3-hydroxy-5,9,17-trioxoandrosta-1(10),2-diene-4-oate hydrolase
MKSIHQPTIDPIVAAAGAWNPIEFHEAAGATIALNRKGAGPKVVCLHATGHGARDFEPFSERCSDDFEVIAVDWPGQGSSPREKEKASAARYSQILDELIPQLSSEPVIVIGCSIGGAAAIQTAARRPDLVRGLVLCDTGGLIGADRTTRFVIGHMTSFFEAGARGAWWFRRAFAMYYRVVLPQPAARAQRERIVAGCRQVAPVLVEAWTSFNAPEADIRALAPHVLCPTLFAWARQDRVIPWSRTQPAASTFPDHRIEMFDAGHAAFLEQPDRFAEVFRNFAASLPEAAETTREHANIADLASRRGGPGASLPSGPWKAATAM